MIWGDNRSVIKTILWSVVIIKDWDRLCGRSGVGISLISIKTTCNAGRPKRGKVGSAGRPNWWRRISSAQVRPRHRRRLGCPPPSAMTRSASPSVDAPRLRLSDAGEVRPASLLHTTWQPTSLFYLPQDPSAASPSWQSRDRDEARPARASAAHPK